MENPAFVEVESPFDLTDKSKSGIKPVLPPDKVYSFEEAVTLTGTGIFHYFLVLVCGLCFMSVIVEIMGISVILPFLKCELDSTITEQGFLASSGFFGIVLSSHVMGFLADTWGRVKTLRSSLMCGFMTSVISAFSINIWMLIIFRFLNGLFISGCQACVFSYLGEFHGNMTRVKHITILSMFLPIALMFLPSMAMAILPLQFEVNVLGLRFTTWRLLLLANSLLSLMAFIGLFLFNESPKYDLIQGRTEKALQTLRKTFKINTGRPESEYPVKQVQVELSGGNLSSVHGVKGALALIWNQTVPLFYKKRILHTMNICFIMFVIFVLSQGTFMWFPTMLDQLVAESNTNFLVCDIINMHGATSNNNTITYGQCGGPVNIKMFQILTLMGAGITIIHLTNVLTIDLVGKKNLLYIWLSISAASSLLIHWVSSFPLSVFLLTAMIGVGNCGGIVRTIAMEYFPTNVNAMGMCLIMMIARSGAAVGSNFVGLVIFTNCDMLFYVYVGIIVLITLCSIYLPDKNNLKKK